MQKFHTPRDSQPGPASGLNSLGRRFDSLGMFHRGRSGFMESELGFHTSTISSEFRKHHFKITERIGHGGMADVYGARFTGRSRIGGLQKGEQVAIKLLSRGLIRDEDVRTRFVMEASTLKDLVHPNIVRLHGIGEIMGLPYFVLEYLEGVDLATHIMAGSGSPKPLPVQAALYITREICNALEAAHSQGIIHRDVKPANIFLVNPVPPNGRQDVKLFDFGIIRELNDESDPEVLHRLTMPGRTVGTPVYMAPEQAKNSPHIDQRSDIYSLGATLYEMISGTPPFMAEDASELMCMHVHAPPQPLSRVSPGSVPENVENIVMRCLAKHQYERFSSARELAAAIESCGLEPKPPNEFVDKRTLAATAKIPALKSRISKTLIGALVVSGALLGTVTHAVWGSKDSQRTGTVQDGGVYRAKIESNIPGASVMIEETLGDGTVVERQLGTTPLEIPLAGKHVVFVAKDGYTHAYGELTPGKIVFKGTMRKR